MDMMYMPMMPMNFENSNNLTLLFKTLNSIDGSSPLKYTGLLLLVFFVGVSIEVLGLMRYKYNYLFSESKIR